MAHTLFTNRSGGVSTAPFDSFNLAAHVGDNPDSVEKNRRILAERIGLPVNSIYFMNQVHGRDVAIDRKSTRLNSSHIPLSRMPSSA